MSPYPKLSKPPIVEAVIEFRVRLPDDVDHSIFEGLRIKLADRFPHHSDIRIVQARLDLQPGVENPSTIDSTFVVVRLESAEKSTVIQATIQSLSVSRLRPYESWEAC